MPDMRAADALAGANAVARRAQAQAVAGRLKTTRTHVGRTKAKSADPKAVLRTWKKR